MVFMFWILRIKNHKNFVTYWSKFSIWKMKPNLISPWVSTINPQKKFIKPLQITLKIEQEKNYKGSKNIIQPLQNLKYKAKLKSKNIYKLAMVKCLRLSYHQSRNMKRNFFFLWIYISFNWKLSCSIGSRQKIFSIYIAKRKSKKISASILYISEGFAFRPFWKLKLPSWDQ
jgi:hypothetical protein